MADKKKMSVEEILAACRKADAPGGGSPPPAPAKGPQAESAGPADETAAAPAKPAAPKPASGGAPKSPAGMNVADILAAARAEKGAAASKPAAQAAAKPAAAKPAAAKPTPTKAPAAAGETPAAALDTSSILAAARKATKPGPVSKAEAPVRVAGAGKPVAVVPPFPEKPAYAKAAAGPSGGAAKSTRRDFLGIAFLSSGLAAGFISLTVTSLLYALGLARFMFPNIRTEPPSQFKVGFPANFAPGSVSTQYTSQFGVWIVNADYDGQPVIVALRTVCTHLGCTPSWLEGEQKFKCPCHGSGFYKDGINFEGPAPRPLERYAIRTADDGQLEVDKSRMFQQEMGQWKDPASFVPA